MPESKNREHVLPLWLIELTGNPNRIVDFGIDKNSIFGSEPKIWQYAFDQYQFPSCFKCNKEFGKLEQIIQHAMSCLLSKEPLSAWDFHHLLNWLDKVRIGLWLGRRYLDKNITGVRPKYYIASRMGITDRMLSIYWTDSERKGLSIIGSDGPLFIYNPCCISMVVNNICIFNMATDYLFSRRLGFPFAHKAFWREEDDRIEIELSKARERVMQPILRHQMYIHGTEVYQPMFPLWSNPEFREYYDIPYVRERSLDFDKGIGSIFRKRDNMLDLYPLTPSKSWIPKRCHDEKRLGLDLCLQTLKWQERLIHSMPSSENLSIGRRKDLNDIFSGGIKYNKYIAEGMIREYSGR